MACDWKQLAGVLAAAGVWTWMSIYSERRKMMEEAAAVVQPAANAVAGVQPAANAVAGVQPAENAVAGVQPAANAVAGVQPAANAVAGVQPAANAVAGVRRVPPEILNAFPVQIPEEIVEFIMELKEKREKEREEAMHAHPRARAILQGLALLSKHLNPGEIVLSLLIRLKSENPTLRSKLVKHVHRIDWIFLRPKIRPIWRAANGCVDEKGSPPIAFHWLLRDVEVAQNIFSTHWDWDDLIGL